MGASSFSLARAISRPNDPPPNPLFLTPPLVPLAPRSQHLMPTRYSLEIDLKAAVPGMEVIGNPAKLKTARGEAKAIFEEKFKSGKNRWFFTKLRF